MLFAHEGRCHAPCRGFCWWWLICVPGPNLGAAHYLLDFIPENLTQLKETIQQKYPDVKVSVYATWLKTPVDLFWVATLQGDAADQTAICEQAINKRGRTIPRRGAYLSMSTGILYGGGGSVSPTLGQTSATD